MTYKLLENSQRVINILQSPTNTFLQQKKGKKTEENDRSFYQAWKKKNKEADEVTQGKRKYPTADFSTVDERFARAEIGSKRGMVFREQISERGKWPRQPIKLTFFSARWTSMTHRTTPVVGPLQEQVFQKERRKTTQRRLKWDGALKMIEANTAI